MKIKNNYIFPFILWIILTLIFGLLSVINFTNYDCALGFIFLILAMAFSFVSGILLIKLIAVENYNNQIDFLNNFAKELYETEMKNIEPFGEFGDKNCYDD